MKALVVEDICKTFGGLEAVSHVPLSVEEGERRVVIGPNGAGKTTLFHMISGILPPTSGRVYLFGEDITFLTLHRRAAFGIAQTFQLVNLFSGLTVLENVLFGLRSFKSRRCVLYKSLRRYGDFTREAVQRLEEWGLAERSMAKVASLSYGEQKLLDILLALVTAPRLLLLDEPTSGLTLAEAKTIVSKIGELTRSVTVLLIEHNVDLALNIADRVTVLSTGKVLAEGTPEEIRQDPLVRQIYLGSGGRRSAPLG